jgi:serine/threonine protein kinase
VLPETLTLECRDLITRMLCVDPAKRIRVETILRHPWLKYHHFHDGPPPPPKTMLGTIKSLFV